MPEARHLQEQVDHAEKALGAYESMLQFCFVQEYFANDHYEVSAFYDSLSARKKELDDANTLKNIEARTHADVHARLQAEMQIAVKQHLEEERTRIRQEVIAEMRAAAGPAGPTGMDQDG